MDILMVVSGYLQRCRRRSLNRLVLVVVCLFSPVSFAQEISALKAAYLFYFSKFVTWKKEQENIVVCVRTEDADLDKQIRNLEGKTTGSKPLHIVPIPLKQDAQSIKQCDVYYSQYPVEDIEELPVGTLIVNDAMHDNTVIAFQVKEGKLSFDINAGKAKQYDLVISSRLLHLAGEVVQ